MEDQPECLLNHVPLSEAQTLIEVVQTPHAYLFRPWFFFCE